MDYQRRPFDTRELIKRNTDKRCFICEFLNRTPGYEHAEVFSTEEQLAYAVAIRQQLQEAYDWSDEINS